MPIRERILQVLSQQPGNMCDDCLAQQANLKRRQVAFLRCTQLAAQGSIHRERGTCSICRKVKNVNRQVDVAPLPPSVIRKGHPPKTPKSENESVDNPQSWYWEGNVQSSLVTYLAAVGYVIRSVADTAARAPGKDICAITPDGKNLWVSVKGYPAEGNASRSTQARHWFAGAVFDLILYREENKDAQLALAFPDGFRTYHNLARRITWLQQAMSFRLFWIDDAGHVREEWGQASE